MENKIISKSFLWMFAGLLITFLTGYAISFNERMIANIFSGSFYIISAIIELILVVVLSARIYKMKPNTARIFFLLYSFISGLTFSSIFIIFEIKSIIFIFLIASLLFLIFGLIGYFTKIDLTKISSFLLMALVAIIICSIINIFLKNTNFNLIISVLTIFAFLGFTAYDIQKIKKSSHSDIPEDNLSIFYALNLYLDYINIFLELLNLFGNTRD